MNQLHLEPRMPTVDVDWSESEKCHRMKYSFVEFTTKLSTMV